MTKYFLIAIACLAALGGVGYALRSRFTEPPARRTPPAIAPRADTAPPDTQVARASVLDVKGIVEKRVGEQWTAIRTGEVLEADDAIRTADDATADVEVGGQRVTLHARTEITIGEISEKVNIVLAEGRLSAKGRDKVMRIEVRNSDAVAEASNAEFDVISAGQGDVTVAATTGAVDLSAAGKRVRVAAGEQSTAAKGDAPSVPTKIPSTLFLKVNAAGGGRQKVATVQGETIPGAIVSINGVRMIAASEGAFELAVPLKEGKNTLVVRVEDVRGRVETASLEKRVDTKKPRLETQVEWK